MKDTCVTGFIFISGLLWYLVWRDSKISQNMPQWIKVTITIAALIFLVALISAGGHE